jgi:hypothetical protein
VLLLVPSLTDAIRLRYCFVVSDARRTEFIFGTKRTRRAGLLMSVVRGRPEVAGRGPNRRDCRVGPGNFTPSLSQIRT